MAASPGPRRAATVAPPPVEFPNRLASALQASAQRLWRLLGALPLLLAACVVAWLAWRLGGWIVQRPAVLRRAKRNPLLGDVLRQAARAVFLLGGVFLGLEIIGATSLAAALLGSAGVVGIALGFAFRDLLENYIASVLLSIRQPFSPDDLVLIDGHEGTVVGMNSRATVLMTPDGNHLRLPNAQVFKSVMVNFTRNGKRRFDFQLTLQPGCDIGGAMQNGLAQVRATPDVLRDPAPFVQLHAADLQGAVLQFFAWVDQRRGNFGAARSEALRRTVERLVSDGYRLGPPTYRLERPAASPEPAPAPPPRAGPPANPAQSPEAIQEAVQQTRDEMAGRDLLRSDARKE